MSTANVMRVSIVALSAARFLPGLKGLESSWIFRTQALEHGVKWFSVAGLVGGLVHQGADLRALLRSESVAATAVSDWLIASSGMVGLAIWLLRKDLQLSAHAVTLPFLLAAAVCGHRWVKAVGVAQAKAEVGRRISRATIVHVALLFVALYWLMPASSAAGTVASVSSPTAGGAFRQAALDMQTFTSFTVQSGQKYGAIFFSALAMVHLPWLLIDKMFSGASDLRGYVGPLLRETTVLSFFGAFLLRGHEISKAIVDVLRDMGKDAAGQDDITPQAAFDSLVKLWDGETLKVAIASAVMGDLFTILCAAVLVCCVCLCVAQLWFEFEGSVAMDLSTVAFGAGGAPWTRWMATNVFRLAAQCGLRLMVTFVLQGLMMRQLDNWKTQIEVDGEITFELIMSMLGCVLLLCLMMWRAHAWVTTITSGNLSPGLDAMALTLPAGLLAGGAAAGIKSMLSKGGSKSAGGSPSAEESADSSTGLTSKSGSAGLGDPSLGGPIPPAASSGSARSSGGVSQVSVSSSNGHADAADSQTSVDASASASGGAGGSPNSASPNSASPTLASSGSGAGAGRATHGGMPAAPGGQGSSTSAGASPRATGSAAARSPASGAPVGAAPSASGTAAPGSQAAIATQSASAQPKGDAKNATSGDSAGGLNGGGQARARTQASSPPPGRSAMQSVLNAIEALQHAGPTGTTPVTDISSSAGSSSSSGDVGSASGSASPSSAAEGAASASASAAHGSMASASSRTSGGGNASPSARSSSMAGSSSSSPSPVSSPSNGLNAASFQAESAGTANTGGSAFSPAAPSPSQSSSSAAGAASGTSSSPAPTGSAAPMSGGPSSSGRSRPRRAPAAPFDVSLLTYGSAQSGSASVDEAFGSRMTTETSDE